eukprot:9252393-Alexandrium_andersonii.AAC.1
MDGAGHERLFLNLSSILRVFRQDAPHLVVDICLLCLPRMGEPWGKCSLCPAGLPLLKAVTDEKLKDSARRGGEQQITR